MNSHEDLVFRGTCCNYRLWCLTGNETFFLDQTRVKDAREFIKGWRADAGQDTYVILQTPGVSVTLGDIVYGLGGAVSEGSGIEWQVIWLACREVLTISAEEFATAQKPESSGISLG